MVVFDEFQRSKGSIGVALHSVIAHSYDFHGNLTLVLTGSEMGVLYGILGDAENPIYGRAYAEVRTRKLTESEPLSFLEAGITEAGVSVDRRELEQVVGELDSITDPIVRRAASKL